MSSQDVIVLNHTFELFIPTQCICGQGIEANLRNEYLNLAKGRFHDLFGGATIKPVNGIWRLPDGSIADEKVDIVESLASEEAYEDHFEDIKNLAVELADQLSQDRVLLKVDGKGFLFARSDIRAKCHHDEQTQPSDPHPVPDEKDNLVSIYYSLAGFSSLRDARNLFCNALNYKMVSSVLPSYGKWPAAIQNLLEESPEIIANTNGFKIVYLHLVADGLRLGAERQIIQRIYQDDPSFCGLFVVSNGAQKIWEFVSAKNKGDGSRQLLLRRMRVGNESVRTATERIALIQIRLAEERTIAAAELQTRNDAAFDVGAVTKQFYRELSNWYFWALKHISFPKDAPKEDDGYDHIGVIRMITRLIFCWFVKEKGLIPEVLFDQRQLVGLLDGFEPDKDANKDSVFYKAILQNLFFATLNTEMDKRGWAKNEQNFMAHSLYRYRDLFKKPNEALALFKNIPFLNGGLFECLDKDLGEHSSPRYVRIDGFSRRLDSQPIVPDFLFFGSEREEDLSADYGDKKFKKVRVCGLIHTLNRYHFTIEENTPLEQEVALDPELSGKVFENLLAAYNPETGATARKQTGSFYTPREIVDYMVDEALIAFLKGSLTTDNTENTEKKLRRLMSWEESGHDFNAQESEILIAAIDSLKALDPAVGSGAFPMGILHKLVFILGKLDPHNELWKQRQIKRIQDAITTVEKIEDVTIREQATKEMEQQIVGIEESFERNKLDYGRKLYLIENCLYGVDIQPIAVQICKMRFFISLIVDQRIDMNASNLGVRPLPNLETRFVAANTLIGILKPKQAKFRNPQIETKEAELRRVRERHFMARTVATKAKCREQDKKLRIEIAKLLRSDGWGDTTAKQLAAWDPYDQNVSARFFDPEWMFGITDGFDVAIGNPPYGVSIKGEYRKEVIQYLGKVPDYEIYYFFLEIAFNLLREKGIISYIIPNTFLFNVFASEYRKELLRKWSIHCLLDCTAFKIFEGATVYNAILLFENSSKNCTKIGYKITSGASNFDELSKRPTNYLTKNDLMNNIQNWGLVFKLDRDILNVISKIKASRDLLEQHFPEYSQGLIAYDKYQGQDETIIKSRAYHYTSQKKKGLKKWLWGEDVSRYKVDWNGKEWIDYCDGIANPRQPKYFKNSRILVREITNPSIFCGYTEDEFYHDPAIIVILDKDKAIKQLLAILNSKLATFYHFNSSPKATKGAFPKILVEDIKKFPLPASNEHHTSVFTIIVDYIIHKIKMNEDPIFFESIIDAMVYELYFPEEVIAAECEVVKYLVNLPKLQDDWSDKNKLSCIDKVYEELSGLGHPLSIAIARQKTVPEVRIIEGIDQ